MPMQRALYPPDWESISRSIRKRALNRCEWPGCGVANGQTIQGKRGPYRVVLTVAHLDHDPSNCAESNLRAWCQPHHLRYDVEHHKRSRSRHRVERAVERGQLALWETPAEVMLTAASPAPIHAASSMPRSDAHSGDALRARGKRQVAADEGNGKVYAARLAPSESHPSASQAHRARRAQPRQRGQRGRQERRPAPMEPLVWGKWPDRETPLVVDDALETRYAFAGEMACGVERMGVLLVAWEQRHEARAAQVWVDVRRVRRVIVGAVETQEANKEEARDGD